MIQLLPMNPVKLCIKNTKLVSFDIRLQERLFNREACRAIQYAFLKPNLVNFISKDANQVFYSSVYPLVDSLK